MRFEEGEEESYRPRGGPHAWVWGWADETMSSPIRHSPVLAGVKPLPLPQTPMQPPSSSPRPPPPLKLLDKAWFYNNVLAAPPSNSDTSSGSSSDSMPLFFDASSAKQEHFQSPSAAASIPAPYTNISAETSDASISSTITDCEMSDQDMAEPPCMQPGGNNPSMIGQQLPGALLSEMVLRRASPTTLARCKTVCRDWNSLLSESEFYGRYEPVARVPWLLNLGSDKIAGYDFYHQGWRLLPYDIPANYTLMSAWSAGNLIMLLLQTPHAILEKAFELSLQLWNPLTHALQLLPRLTLGLSLRGTYSFAFTPDKILAIGSYLGESIVELLDLNTPLTNNWRFRGCLPSGYLVEPDQEIIHLHGSFYALCMSPYHNTMVVIHAQEPWFTLHDTPASPRPRLVSCNNTIFLVGDEAIDHTFNLWEFDGHESWTLIPHIDCPVLGLPPPKILSVLGIQNLICFCLQHNFVIVYDVSHNQWHCLTVCPLEITRRLVVWEPRFT